MRYPRVMIAGTASGVGKTTISTAIMLALKDRGIKTQPFKAGPDYVDPTHHSLAAGRVSANLDGWMCSRASIIELFCRRAQDADISIIEGVMGLYDGFADTEEGSSAHLAKMLGCPVVLILDARSLSRSQAAVVLGFKNFDKKVNIAGVILNNIGSPVHYQHIKNSIENSVRVKVLGYFPKNPKLSIKERHLGLVPAVEKAPDSKSQKELLNMAKRHIDIKGLLKIGQKAKPLGKIKQLIFSSPMIVGTAHCAVPTKQVVIAVAKDKAFNFYYQDNLDILKGLGARLVEFSPLADKGLPKDTDGVYIGGGFPELFAQGLSANKRMKADILNKAKNEMPIYAECGGLMYLMKALRNFQKEEFPMAGVFSGKVNMGKKLRGLGYVTLRCVSDNILSRKYQENRAHIFHWSYLSGVNPSMVKYAYKISKNNETFYDGLIKNNVLASYAHLHFASNIKFAENFVQKCREYGKAKAL